ncbi:hypothetical protein CXG81DRAFT_25643 [Caulochytrium protostelioides]|uniref:Uncharacterized protein n=1 Tax=Caulochytrium protostelioides TaxID=1555241 RepID=A0A4P9X8R6_9FUNG|nr:hypothetical protein CXG81DRAFT_25643 [Caulochytrium protostelioides]|eukprot:RKP01676.1 hypothetical protein CXG81DRAFT_25643 [Caulochytrium protostelioides]
MVAIKTTLAFVALTALSVQAQEIHTNAGVPAVVTIDPDATKTSAGVTVQTQGSGVSNNTAVVTSANATGTATSAVAATGTVTTPRSQQTQQTYNGATGMAASSMPLQSVLAIAVSAAAFFMMM